MSKVNTILWSSLKFKYSPLDNYHGTCYYGALKLLLGKEFEATLKNEFTQDILENKSTHLNSMNALSKWANKSPIYRFADIEESLHDEEGVIWLSCESGKNSHIVYFKDGYYYDDYMSLSSLEDLSPLLIIVKKEK